jgi:hypothetical protein
MEFVSGTSGMNATARLIVMAQCPSPLWWGLYAASIAWSYSLITVSQPIRWKIWGIGLRKSRLSPVLMTGIDFDSAASWSFDKHGRTSPTTAS